MLKVYDHTKCVFWNNQPYITRPTLVNLNPNKCSQGLHYYQILVKTNRCNGNCNTFNDFPNRVCVPSKKEDINLSVLIWMNLKQEQDLFLVIVNVNLAVKNVIWNWNKKLRQYECKV